MWDNSLIQLFGKGGLFMWPLLLCSVVGLAVIIERAIFFLRIRVNYEAFLQELAARVRSGDFEGAQQFCRSIRHPVGRISDTYLKHRNAPDQYRNEILRRDGSLALEGVEKRLRWLSLIAHIAPLLGLLGTVTGLVTAFHRIELLAGVVRPSDLAGGIWEALLTTVFGLVIAIPCMAAYYGFESKADEIARRMQLIISELNEHFGRVNGNGAVQRAPSQPEIAGVE